MVELTIKTSKREEFIDITNLVERRVREIDEGLVCKFNHISYKKTLFLNVII